MQPKVLEQSSVTLQTGIEKNSTHASSIASLLCLATCILST